MLRFRDSTVMEAATKY